MSILKSLVKSREIIRHQYYVPVTILKPTKNGIGTNAQTQLDHSNNYYNIARALSIPKLAFNLTLNPIRLQQIMFPSLFYTKFSKYVAIRYEHNLSIPLSAIKQKTRQVNSTRSEFL